MPRNNPIRCPQCNRLGTNPEAGLAGLCKSCAAKQVCFQCGEPAYKYLGRSGYHSWYCERHYNDKVEELDNPVNPFRDDFSPDFNMGSQFIDPNEENDFGIIKDQFGEMTKWDK